MTNAEPSSKEQPEPIIRDATTDDAAAIAEIYNIHIQTGLSTMDAETKSARDMADLIQNFSPRETILVYDCVGDILGWGIIKRYSDRLGYRVACETSVYLKPNLVGRGLGTRMKKAIIQRCKDYGYHHLVAKIFAQNKSSIIYNQKLGYEMVGIQKEIGYRNGGFVDIAIMQLILKDVPPYKPEAM